MRVFSKAAASPSPAGKKQHGVQRAYLSEFLALYMYQLAPPSHPPPHLPGCRGLCWVCRCPGLEFRAPWAHSSSRPPAPASGEVARQEAGDTRGRGAMGSVTAGAGQQEGTAGLSSSAVAYARISLWTPPCQSSVPRQNIRLSCMLATWQAGIHAHPIGWVAYYCIKHLF